MSNVGFRLGFIVNPYAGIGGPLGYKGSDLAELQTFAQHGQCELRAPGRAKVFWQHLLTLANACECEIVSAPGILGGDILAECKISHEPLPGSVPRACTANHTQIYAKALVEYGIDLLVFVGGDGTARDIYAAVGEHVLVLGIPSGVKMHSGVYAINPQLAAELVASMINGDLISDSLCEVRDIDEVLFRQGQVKAKHFGQMRTPFAAEYVQAVKQGGIENEDLVVLDIADYLKEKLDPNALIIWGPGSTTQAVLREWGQEGTLLGVDALTPDGQLQTDLNATSLIDLAEDYDVIALVVSAIGGQGHILGRGNQQLTPVLLNKIGRDNLHVLATKAKLATLNGRPLNLDTGSPELDAKWRGLLPIITGFENHVLYPVR